MTDSSPVSASAAEVALPVPETPPPTKGRGWRWLAGGLLAWCMVVFSVGWTTWVWMGTDTALSTTLEWASRWLPAGQQLELRGVRGSLRKGGQVDWLRWQGPSLAVEVRGVELRWHLASLWQRHVQVDQLHVADVHITATPETDKPPPEPLQALLLPVTVTLPFQIDQIVWAGHTRLEAGALRGRYVYDGSAHQLDIERLALAQGQYSAQARVQAQAPMALRADVQGQVKNPLPQTAQPLTVAAQAHVEGTLATAAARLSLQASLRPVVPDGATTTGMGAEVAVQLAPWAIQPLQQLQADVQSLNLAALWPQAPQTALRGQVQVLPVSPGWTMAVQLHNDAAGPWDRQRLPLSQLDAQAHYDGSQWHLPQVLAQVGTGRVQAQGRYTPSSHMVQGSVQMQNLNPATLHGQLDAVPLNGWLRAQSQDGVAVDFSADVRAVPVVSARKMVRLPIQHIQAQGRWKAPTLALQRLQVDALQARLEADGLSLLWGPAPVVRGTLALTVPGARLHASGLLGAAQGKGALEADVAAADRLLQWVQALPGGATLLSQQRVQGQAKLALHWQGGWDGLLHRPVSPAQATPLRWEATLAVPTLLLAPPSSTTERSAPRLELSAIQAQASGTAYKATLRLDAQAGWAPYRATLHSSIHAERGGGATPSPWKAQLAALQLQLQHQDQSGGWRLKLDQALEAVWHPSISRSVAAVLDVAAGQASITGPLPGTVSLQWQPLQWRWAESGGMQLQTRGHLAGLPLAWVDALAPAKAPMLAAAGLGSQLMLEADWDIQTHPTLRAQLQLQRTQGDLHLLHDQAAATAAGLRAARLRLEAVDDNLRAQLVWDSAQAGQVQVQASTRLRQQDSGWVWPEDAPVAAHVQARLPDMGVWSVLAPPGWRIHGTLDADATLSGSRQAPRWQGRIDADQLALRSLVDGVDLQEGRLRTVLRGDRLDITEWYWRGGKGSQARIAGYSGNLTSAPRDRGSLQGSGSIRWHDAGIHLDLQAQAQALQVLVRADRQASVSGTVRAQLQQGQLVLWGQLQVDRAAILLPDASAPRLGEDVEVRSTHRRPQMTARPAPSTTVQAQTPKPIDMAVTVDLGRDFALQGYGLTTRLRGQLELRSSPVQGMPPRVTGEVQTEQGRYRAWGQMLDIETGLLRFSGAHDNPALDILAIRPNINVRAGVQVSGVAQAPRVRLYADPELTDAEKLAWVVTGRSSAAGGAEAALLQQAALALLGKQGVGTGGVARKLGLDEIGFKAPDTGNGASAAAITLGKRLSSKLYVTYEHGLSGAVGMISVFYDLSRRLTLRGQTGTQSALDIIYTVRHD
ncbi:MULTISPECIES: translocation/assembly module TamB domain-containing protein [Giesbergeria]|uniref:translocation/assembly module TamB domain-containing protein n=1 Tax=Giesbergeria sinuosa TaxID=80883 RepID=UPI0036D21AD8